MFIRELLITDTLEYQTLILRGVKAHPESFRISADDAGEPFAPFAIPKPDAFTLGAFSPAGLMVGTVSFEREARLKLRHKGLLYRMYVDASAAGQGVGRKLIRESVRRAQSMEQLERINLTVVATNTRARNLYLSEGFLPFALEKKGLQIGGEYFDEEQMTLLLAPTASERC